MFTEFVATYVPFAIATVILVPVVLVHVAMFIDSLRTKRWKAAARVAKAAAAAPASVARRATPRRQPARTFTGGLGLRHGVAARCDHD